MFLKKQKLLTLHLQTKYNIFSISSIIFSNYKNNQKEYVIISPQTHTQNKPNIVTALEITRLELNKMNCSTCCYILDLWKTPNSIQLINYILPSIQAGPILKSSTDAIYI